MIQRREGFIPPTFWRVVWIHFVGRTSYTPNRFMKEAERTGSVTRPISRDMARAFAVRGARQAVLFAYEPKRGRTRVFAWGLLDVVAGPVYPPKLPGPNYILSIDPGGDKVVQREVGSYVIDTVYTCRLGFCQAMAELVSAHEGQDWPNIMAGCHRLIPHHEVILNDVQSRRGFRLFNYEAFYYQVQAWERELRVRNKLAQECQRKPPRAVTPVVRGLYYATELEHPQPRPSNVIDFQVIHGYTKGR